MAQRKCRGKAESGLRGKLVVLGYLSEIEERISQGWFVSSLNYHPVMMAYGRVYYWRWL